MAGALMANGLLTRIEYAVGFAILATIVVLVFMAAVMRFYGYPIIWSVDFAQLLFIWLCFLGANRALRKRVHLGVDLLIRRAGHRTRLWVETVLAAVVVAFLLTLAKVGVDLTLLNKERLFGDSGIPYAFVTISVPVGAVFLALTVLANTREAWKERGTGKLIFTRTDPLPDGGEL
jgi:TRAP-type C4-dicarboxylate transport system permease small subunit